MIDRADVGLVLDLLTEVVQSTDSEILQQVSTVLSQLGRSRVDLLSPVFAMLVTLCGRLLHRVNVGTTLTTARAISRALVDLVASNHLDGGWSKHAPFVLLRYLRRQPPIELRNALNPGIRALINACGAHEREALLGGFLRSDEDAERTVLRALVQANEAVRYKGDA